jgi:hypothetical protein
MNKSKMKIKGVLVSILIICSLFVNSCSNNNILKTDGSVDNLLSTKITEDGLEEALLEEDKVEENKPEEELHEEELPKDDLYQEDQNIVGANDEFKETAASINDDETIEFNGTLYNIIQVDGGDLSGDRKANVAVDIGFGDREYWAFTNEHGQLVYVYTDRIIPQDDETEQLNADGRYYGDEAKVSGTEHKDLDEGHVIADSLGGVSNAYNITPQDSTLNRHGDQAYMEKVIRDAGGCEKFFATITYPDTTTQVPSNYHYKYILNGENVVDDFDNVNPDEINNAIIQQENESVISKDVNTKEDNDLSVVDVNGNGKVTIAEAKAAGYKMPIYSDHWLFSYMDDRDGDGMVGE